MIVGLRTARTSGEASCGQSLSARLWPQSFLHVNGDTYECDQSIPFEVEDMYQSSTILVPPTITYKSNCHRQHIAASSRDHVCHNLILSACNGEDIYIWDSTLISLTKKKNRKSLRGPVFFSVWETEIFMFGISSWSNLRKFEVSHPILECGPTTHTLYHHFFNYNATQSTVAYRVRYLHKHK